MKSLLCAAAALLLAGCAIPLVNTELPPGWTSAKHYGTGTHMSPAINSSVKYMSGGQEVAEMQRDRTGSKERPPR